MAEKTLFLGMCVKNHEMRLKMELDYNELSKRIRKKHFLLNKYFFTQFNQEIIIKKNNKIF